MKRMKKLVVLTVMVGAVLALGARDARAADVICATGVVLTGTINGNVIVPAGVDCVIDATVVGNVDALPGALSLTLFGAVVLGNIDAEDVVGRVLVRNVIASGNVEISGPGGPESQAVVCGLRSGGNLNIQKISLVTAIGPTELGGCLIGGNNIGGDVTVRRNTGSLVIAFSTVTGSLSVLENTGNTSVGGNSIGGTLKCEDNMPSFALGGNVATKKKGQCAVP
jgi:hypothetical protein